MSESKIINVFLEMSKMESAEEIGVRVENLIHQVDHLSDKAESLISLDAGTFLLVISDKNI